MKNLGFGMMRLPVMNGDPTNFDYEHLNAMVDEFLAAGYTYFDTSFVYHNGKSEEATRKAVVERHPRDSFTVATKFPTFFEMPEEKIEETFRLEAPIALRIPISLVRSRTEIRVMTAIMIEETIKEIETKATKT